MRALRPHAQNYSLTGFIATLSAVYVFVLVNAPLSLIAGAMHDDGLFIALGSHLSERQWLGTYNQFTLMKGPGYPAFLVLSNFFGASSTLALALFHCLAVTGFTMICHRFHRSVVLSALLFILLLWDPTPLEGQQHRILRDTIYYGQTLLSLAVLTYALFTRGWMAGLAGGLLLGWFWLTREEGLWVVPGIGLVVVAGLYRAFSERSLRQFLATLLAVAVAFGLVNASFRAMNWWKYGMAVGVDSKEPNFVSALQAIHSVRSGGIAPFVSVTHAARNAIYPVSPAFASLRPHLDGQLGQSWGTITCAIQAFTCGEIGSGVFIWALRDAVAAAGHYATPAQASQFYGILAGEIDAACVRKQLECDRQVIAEMPPATWTQLAGFPVRAFNGLKMILSARWQPVDGGPTLASMDQLATALRFLNYPFINAPDGSAQTAYVINGWYYKAGGGWFSVSVTEGSESVPVLMKRSASPDIAFAFKDADASQQRFTLHTICSGSCVLRIATTDGNIVEMPLKDVRAGELKIGQGTLYFDPAAGGLRTLYEPNWRNRVSFRVREAVMRSFELVRVPLLVLGLLASIGCLFYGREAALSSTYVMALAAWALAASRIAVIALLDLTFVPAVNPVYLAPASFLMTAAAILSIAAWIELRRGHAPVLGKGQK